MSDFWDNWGGVIVIVCVLVLFFAGIAGIDFLVNKHICLSKTAEIGFPSKYDIWSGCRIFVESRWIPLENWYFKTQ